MSWTGHLMCKLKTATISLKLFFPDNEKQKTSILSASCIQVQYKIVPIKVAIILFKSTLLYIKCNNHFKMPDKEKKTHAYS